MKYFTKGLHNKISALLMLSLLVFSIASFVYADTETIQYGYDREKQITNVTYDDGTDVEYVYDGAGNRWL